MEGLRTSLWSRLVVFYSVNKKDQLNPEVMAEIVAKYGSKEKELSARLLKKYGQPLRPSVPAQDLRRVLLEYGMDDQDVEGGAGPAPAAATAAAAAAADGTSDEGTRRDPPGAARLEDLSGQGERQAARPPRGSELNFRSKFFDPLQALNHETLRPPFPRERALDNLAKFARIMPKRATAIAATTATATATDTTIPGGAATGAEANPMSPTTSTPTTPAAATGTMAATASHAFQGTPQQSGAGKSARDTAAGRGRSSPVATESAAAHGCPVSKLSAGNAEGGTIAAGGGATRRRGHGESGDVGSVGGHYGPPVGSAEELDRIDKEMASKRRNAEILAGGVVGSAVLDEERFNPVQRIIREYAGKGPYSLLYRLHEDKRRASVMIRRVNSIRGTCTGLIRAFDKHMNLLLVDVREDYTAFVPARDPKSSSKRQERRPQRASSPNLLQEMGVGFDEEGEDSHGKPADVGDTSSSRGVRAGVGGEGGEGGFGGGGGASWEGGGSVSWGGGDGGVEEAKGLSHQHGMTAQDAYRESAVGAEELEAGGGIVGDRGAVAPAAGFTGACAKSTTAESVIVRNKQASSPLGETQIFAETTSGGSRETSGIVIDTEQGAGRLVRMGQAQPPRGEKGKRSSDSAGVGGQGQQGSFEQPPAEGRGANVREGRASGPPEAKKSTRRSRGRGPWTGELVPVRRRRFLKQLMIRGDNVVMIWECPKR